MFDINQSGRRAILAIAKIRIISKRRMAAQHIWAALGFVALSLANANDVIFCCNPSNLKQYFPARFYRR